jgi:short-subunit dehydrogenase
MRRFEGKVALITGASAGIGAASARRFAAEGATIAIVARGAEALERVAAEIRAGGGDARTYPGDVSDPTRCAEIVEAVVRDLGGIDVLVNNAGANRRGPVETREPGELAQIVRVNLIAPIVLTRLAIPHLRRRGRGAIVNVASIAGQVPLPEEATYSATKFGLRAFTFAVREELEASGITVSAVSPGPVETGFILEELDEVPDLVFANPMSSADEIAAAVLDCAADGAIERTIPLMTGILARVGNALPALRRLLVPVLERRGKVEKERFREKHAGRAGTGPH